MHFNDFVKYIRTQLCIMTQGNKDVYFAFYRMDTGALVSGTSLVNNSINGEVNCIFKINNIQDDNFEVVFNEGCGELLLEDFESQECTIESAVKLATKMYEMTCEM